MSEGTEARAAVQARLRKVRAATSVQCRKGWAHVTGGRCPRAPAGGVLVDGVKAKGCACPCHYEPVSGPDVEG